MEELRNAIAADKVRKADYLEHKRKIAEGLIEENPEGEEPAKDDKPVVEKSDPKLDDSKLETSQKPGEDGLVDGKSVTDGERMPTEADV